MPAAQQQSFLSNALKQKQQQQQQIATNETALRKEWMPKAQPFLNRQQKAHEVLNLLSTEGAGTALAGRYGFQKMLDETMVTEGDMASLAAMGSSLDKLESLYNSFLSGDISAGQRKELFDTVLMLAESSQRDYAQVRSPYEGIVKRGEYTPENVFASGFQQRDPRQFYAPQIEAMAKLVGKDKGGGGGDGGGKPLSAAERKRLEYLRQKAGGQ
jgi:hypothetical protein